MRIAYGIRALVLTIALSATPLIANAALTEDQKAAITVAVEAAMTSGETSDLQTLLSSIVKTNPGDAADVATLASQEIARVAAANPGATLPGATTPIAETVTAATLFAIVAAAPGQGGAALTQAQAALPPNLAVVAVTATQNALAPAAGGVGTQAGNDVRQLVSDFKQLLSTITQTAEIPRQVTASPSI